MTRHRGFQVGFFVVSVLMTRPSDAGQESSERDRPYWRTNLFSRVVADQRFLVTTWFPAECRRPMFSGPMALAFAGAFAAGNSGEPRSDLKWVHAAGRRHSRRVDSAARSISAGGNGLVLVAALGSTYLFSRHVGNERLAGTSSLATEALASAGLWVLASKAVLARARPNATDEGRFLRFRNSQADSFPSGHTTAAFAVAAVFADRYEERRWVPWLAYGGASLVAASRLTLGRHFPSDILAGAVLGASLGHMVVARNEGGGTQRPPRRGRLVPILAPDGRGVGVGLDLSR